ncbi:hypothetical protein SR1949_50200 [Sphaerospermopsis reniformis]|jgi:hypothetical protein|uniref:Uncharacterized protein n=1 Tax=Sphaerospermopsis reniformis TaxID=531300 RepID=A0A480A4Y7_9CYAN|nr:hypothetical protein SR1949_50200 [Sphaerospermopsis reniformis]
MWGMAKIRLKFSVNNPTVPEEWLLLRLLVAETQKIPHL